MKSILCGFITLLLTSGCVVVAAKDLLAVNKCEISSDRKTLKIINGFKDTHTYYSVSGLILLPITGVVSSIYVTINNIYHVGEKAVVCGSGELNTL
jgi:hypothetical protein